MGDYGLVKVPAMRSMKFDKTWRQRRRSRFSSVKFCKFFRNQFAALSPLQRSAPSSFYRTRCELPRRCVHCFSFLREIYQLHHELSRLAHTDQLPLRVRGRNFRRFEPQILRIELSGIIRLPCLLSAGVLLMDIDGRCIFRESCIRHVPIGNASA